MSEEQVLAGDEVARENVTVVVAAGLASMLTGAVLLAAARDEDIGALFDEPLCRRQPNPFCPAGDDGGLAFEPSGHCPSPSCWAGTLPLRRFTLAHS